MLIALAVSAGQLSNELLGPVRAPILQQSILCATITYLGVGCAWQPIADDRRTQVFVFSMAAIPRVIMEATIHHSALTHLYAQLCCNAAHWV